MEAREGEATAAGPTEEARVVASAAEAQGAADREG